MKRQNAIQLIVGPIFYLSILISSPAYTADANLPLQKTTDLQSLPTAKVERILTIARCENHTTHYFAEKLVSEAYRRIGITAKFAALPCRRSIVMANAGKFDGEVARIRGTPHEYRNLIALSSPVIEIEGVVITKSTSLKVESVKDLQGLKIGIVSGERYAEMLTRDMSPLTTSDYTQLVNLLLAGRIDVGIGIKRDIRVTLARFSLPKNEIRIVGKPLIVEPLFHLIHKRNAALAPQLEAAFINMWQTGYSKALNAQTMTHMLARAKPVESSNPAFIFAK